MRRLVVVLVLIGATAVVSGQSSISITSIDRASAPTLSMITINGNGFDARGAISVVFSARDAITVTVPAVIAGANAIGVITPPLINTTTGEVFDTPVVADVEVVQATGNSLITSNTLGGLSVEPPPRTSGDTGTFTRAFLRTIIDVQSDLRSARGSTTGFGQVISASQAFSDAQRPLLDAVETIIAHPDTTVNLPTSDNLPLPISAKTLRVMDRFAMAYVTQVNEATTRAGTLRVRAAETPAGCQCGPSQEEQLLCEFRRNPCAAYDVAKKVVPEAAAGVYAAQFGFLAGWAAGGLASAGVIASEAASGLSYLAGQALSYTTAVLAGVEPPGAWSLLRDTGSTVLDELTKNGLGVFAGLNTGIALGQTIEQVVTQSRGELPNAPHGGVILAGSQPPSPPANTRPSVVYTASQAPRWVATSVNQLVTALSTSVLPPPAVNRFDGAYGGTAGGSCTATTPEGPITVSAQEGISATVAGGVVSVEGFVGSVSETGRFTAPSSGIGGVSCSVGGRFWTDTNGRAGATGFFTCSGSNVSCAGPWNLARR